MAYIPGFKHDIFISYSRNDDAPMEGEKPWVSTFLKSLKSGLKAYFASGVDALDIFFDQHSLSSTAQTEDLRGYAASSALFLAVCSPNYQHREWTNRELDSFLAHCNDPSRLLAVERLPLRNKAAYPPLLQDANKVILWQKEDFHNHPGKWLPPDHPLFIERVSKLAADIADRLDAMHPGQTRIPVVPVSIVPRVPVLLAQTTDSLDDQLDDLRIYLRENGVIVYPEKPYRQDGESFAAAFNADLASAGLFVQLLGQAPGKKPQDLPQGYTQFQAEAAQASGIRMLQWRGQDVAPEKAKDTAHRVLLDGAIVEGFEGFKKRVLAASERPPAPVPAAPGAGRTRVFVNAHPNDEEIAEYALKKFDPSRFAAAVPLWGGDSKAFKDVLKANIKACQALVVIYGKVDPTFARVQCENYMAMRLQKPARVVAVIYTPAVDEKNKEKRPVGIALDELVHCVIDEPGGLEALRPDPARRIYRYPDLDTAIDRVIEKLGA